VGGVADNGGCVPCGLAFSKQRKVCPCSSAYFVRRLYSRIYGLDSRIYGIYISYILESIPHSFYGFRGLKYQMRITIAGGLDSRSGAGF
jgi:hypothetical protein